MCCLYILYHRCYATQGYVLEHLLWQHHQQQIKITHQSTSATNVASVAFAIQHKDKIIITFFPFLLFTTDSVLHQFIHSYCWNSELYRRYISNPIDSCKVFQHYYSVSHTITYSIRHNQHNLHIICNYFYLFQRISNILQLSLLLFTL